MSDNHLNPLDDISFAGLQRIETIVRQEAEPGDVELVNFANLIRAELQHRHG
jgi:hypothetical protein